MVFSRHLNWKFGQNVIWTRAIKQDHLSPPLWVHPYSSLANTECLVAMAAPPSDAGWSCVLIDVTNFSLADSKIVITQNSRSKVRFGISLKVSGYTICFIIGGRWNAYRVAVCDVWAGSPESIWLKNWIAVCLLGWIGVLVNSNTTPLLFVHV